MKKQTAVEWLIEQMNWDFCYDSTQKIIEQAKAMEKEQIEQAYWDGYQNIPSMKPEQYYKETYSK